MTRRVHLYLGLLLWPIVLLFAITGLSFNHPTVGRGLRTKQVSADELQRVTGFRPWDPERIAASVVERLNGDSGSYRLSDDHDARFSGWPVFAAPTERGREVLILSLDSGSATLTERPSPPAPPKPPFAGAEVRLDGYDLEELARRLSPVLAAHGIETQGDLAPRGKSSPEVRFRLVDGQGVTWNVVYDLATGKLSGREASAAPQRTWAEALEAIHKQHHFPPHQDITFWWALLADATAITLILWALSGLVMWWQLRRLRKAGAVVIAVALTLATVMITGVHRELTFLGTSAER